MTVNGRLDRRRFSMPRVGRNFENSRRRWSTVRWMAGGHGAPVVTLPVKVPLPPRMPCAPTVVWPPMTAVDPEPPLLDLDRGKGGIT